MHGPRCPSRHATVGCRDRRLPQPQVGVTGAFWTPSIAGRRPEPVFVEQPFEGAVQHWDSS